MVAERKGKDEERISYITRVSVSTCTDCIPSYYCTSAHIAFVCCCSSLDSGRCLETGILTPNKRIYIIITRCTHMRLLLLSNVVAICNSIRFWIAVGKVQNRMLGDDVFLENQVTTWYIHVRYFSLSIPPFLLWCLPMHRHATTCEGGGR